MRTITVPDPLDRLPITMYAAARAWLVENDTDAPRMVAWSERETRPPETPEKMAAEVIWIILCAGRSAQAARTIEAKVWSAINSGRPVVEAFGYRAKAAAIERAWNERHSDFAALQKVLASADAVALIDWCKSIPYIGDDTSFQLAKNFGENVPKPDRWLARLAGIPDKPRAPVTLRFNACLNLCRVLSEATGDRVATVDSILWLACNKGVLVTDSMAGPVTLHASASAARSIYLSALDATVLK
jgi:hypothetical protein